MSAKHTELVVVDHVVLLLGLALLGSEVGQALAHHTDGLGVLNRHDQLE